MNRTALQVKSREFAIIQIYIKITVNRLSSEAKKYEKAVVLNKARIEMHLWKDETDVNNEHCNY